MQLAIAKIPVTGKPEVKKAQTDLEPAIPTHSVWKTRSLPSVRPLTICEAKTGFAIHIVESIVHGENAGRWI